MKNIKCKNYALVLQAEYARLKKYSSPRTPQHARLQDMADLLARVDKLKSPAKEQAFVEGVMELAKSHPQAA